MNNIQNSLIKIDLKTYADYMPILLVNKFSLKQINLNESEIKSYWHCSCFHPYKEN